MTQRDRMAARIQKARRARGWSQEELARRAGVTRPYLARLETGRQDPRVSTIVKLARALRVPVGRLVG
jgi:transcriptional regulator with XRE-family HTH domain